MDTSSRLEKKFLRYHTLIVSISHDGRLLSEPQQQQVTVHLREYFIDKEGRTFTDQFDASRDVVKRIYHSRRDFISGRRNVVDLTQFQRHYPNGLSMQVFFHGPSLRSTCTHETSVTRGHRNLNAKPCKNHRRNRVASGEFRCCREADESFFLDYGANSGVRVPRHRDERVTRK